MYLYVRYVQEMVPSSSLTLHKSIRSNIITFVTMKISPSVIATCCWAVLASSDVWVSVKNDDLEATVVALSCTLLRLFSSGKGKKLSHLRRLCHSHDRDGSRIGVKSAPAHV